MVHQVVLNSDVRPAVNDNGKRHCRRIPHLKQCILRKGDTESFEKVSNYTEVLSLNEFHFLMHSLILAKFMRNWHQQQRKGLIV